MIRDMVGLLVGQENTKMEMVLHKKKFKLVYSHRNCSITLVCVPSVLYGTETWPVWLLSESAGQPAAVCRSQR